VQCRAAIENSLNNSKDNNSNKIANVIQVITKLTIIHTHTSEKLKVKKKIPCLLAAAAACRDTRHGMTGTAMTAAQLGGERKGMMSTKQASTATDGVQDPRSNESKRRRKVIRGSKIWRDSGGGRRTAAGTAATARI
jgi:hypothetical protein